MTNRECALALFLRRPGEWIGGQEFVEAGAGYRYAARIWELRQPKWGGHNIEERRDPTGRSALGQWRYIAEPVQTSLGLVAA